MEKAWTASAGISEGRDHSVVFLVGGPGWGLGAVWVSSLVRLHEQGWGAHNLWGKELADLRAGQV